MSDTMRQYRESDSTSADMQHALQSLKQQKPSHKRKREGSEQNGRGKEQASRRDSTSANPHGNDHDSIDIQQNYFANESNSNNFTSIGQQLARHNAGANAMPSTAAAALAASMPQLTVPQPTEMSFNGNDEDRQLDSSFDMGHENHAHHSEGPPYNLDVFNDNGAAQLQAARDSLGGGQKPQVGSEEWHKVRKDNHKEVERRRRETINEGINELAKIVPGCDKNKGAILQRGVQYITQLKDNETRNIEKWTLEKLLTDQAIAELSTSNDKLKSELDRTRKECETWKKICQNAGLGPTEGNGGGTNETSNT